LKLVKGQLARVVIPLDTSSAPFSPILLRLKIRKEKIQKPNNFKSKENINSIICIKKKVFLLVLIND
jgi:hypothetical protein